MVEMRIGCVNNSVMIWTNNNYIPADVESAISKIMYMMSVSYRYTINRPKILAANLTAMLII